MTKISARARAPRHRERIVGESPFSPAIPDYAHNLFVGTALRRLGPRELHRIESVDLVVEMARSARGIHQFPPATGVEPTRAQIRTGLRAYLRSKGDETREPSQPDLLVRRNLALLRDLAGLKDEDMAILRFLLAVKDDRELQDLTAAFGELGMTSAAGVIAAATGLAKETVLAALGRRSRLVESGLVQVEQGINLELSSKIDVHVGVLDLALAPELDREKLVARFLPKAPPSTLGWADFDHLRASAELARDLVRAALREKRPGVNLLLYGETGTGKTELARLLAQDLGAGLYVAGLADGSGESATGRERIGSLLLGQRMFAGGSELLLFDEMEDIHAWGGRRPGILGRGAGDVVISKQWFNEHLETNPVPTIWITNDPTGFDPAYLRRFTYAIEFRPLGIRQRARILSRHAGSLDRAEVEAIAARFESSPAQIGGAVAAAASIGRVDRAGMEAILAPVEKLLTGRDPSCRTIFDPSRYRLDALCSSEDPDAIAERLAGWTQGDGPGLSLCLYGPPGTGKSEYVRYLAHRMGRPVIQRRASDIASKWVGETEQHIKAAFRQAEDDDAVLLFDEADTFLRDRRAAAHSWEVSQVNEFLQQLEAFRGVVACTTNLWGELDEAALRRFVFKIEFRPLGTKQALTLLRSTLASFGVLLVGDDEEDARRRLSRHSCLTPGDFATVARRERALGATPSSRTLLDELEVEIDAKRDAPRAIGF